MDGRQTIRLAHTSEVPGVARVEYGDEAATKNLCSNESRPTRHPTSAFANLINASSHGVRNCQ